MKEFKDISWLVDESTYREDSAISYSTLSTYESVGFNGLQSLKDKKESSSLTFGSAVDSIITGGQKEFDERFLVADFPEMSDTMLKIVKQLYSIYGTSCASISDISEDRIRLVTNELEYGKTWRASTVKDKVVEACSDYYNLLFLAGDKTILSTELYTKVLSSVRALKESEATKFYFQDDDPFDNTIKRYYQLKFKAKLNDIWYRCMADLIIVDYDKKIVYPKDLKTSSDYEWDFYKAFIKWHYQLQARLYWRLIRAVMDTDPYFKDFKLANYEFIVVNKETLTPLVWEFPFTTTVGTIKLGKDKQIELKDPEDLGKELYNYLISTPAVPNGINQNTPNNLITWLNTL